ncbi:nitrous oxide-stimulated promoter family protein [Vibrio sp. 404]|uniref:Nitrous oxide-stimulated promoter family protein n=1 Tax=Vibrio marinisediminis TaxID=2758441 RepID=A0A7W2FMC5_9VIBR|nr:nitrous oxide-stimulated promoter family protein [Vibrio marinisediminis]MBA5760754.1 nitrous oxide-stimulated promoter family protein [Vibrio marinisediminis]
MPKSKSLKPNSDILSGELFKEYKTVAYMMEIYCKNHHVREGTEALCLQCQELLTYAEVRLDRCPYGQKKPTCNRCPIHCYKPQPKADMKLVMRYAGPRMLVPHPILAIRHLIHERRPVPDAKPAANQSNRHLRTKK